MTRSVLSLSLVVSPKASVLCTFYSYHNVCVTRNESVKFHFTINDKDDVTKATRTVRRAVFGWNTVKRTECLNTLLGLFTLSISIEAAMTVASNYVLIENNGVTLQ